MRNRIIVVAGIVLLGFWLGARANRPIVKKPRRRSLGDQLRRARRHH